MQHSFWLTYFHKMLLYEYELNKRSDNENDNECDSRLIGIGGHYDGRWCWR